MKTILAGFSVAAMLTTGTPFKSLHWDDELTQECPDAGEEGTKYHDALTLARQLKAPKPETVIGGEFEDDEFWKTHGSLLRDAWNQLETMCKEEECSTGNKLHNISTPDIFDPIMKEAVHDSWESPSVATEERTRSLFEEVAPGVYKCQLLTVQGITTLRSYLDLVSSSGIPKRRPNGMNRYGFIVDGGSSSRGGHHRPIDGAVSVSGLDSFYNELVDTYFRPCARMLFPSFIGGHGEDDAESYGFTIRYRHDEDAQLNEHSDASLVTININLNFPDERYSGSSIYFVDEKDQTTKHYITFEPGMALLHRGTIRHAALPIEEGERHNLVVWLFGKDGYVRIAPDEKRKEQLTVKQRWAKN